MNNARTNLFNFAPLASVELITTIVPFFHSEFLKLTSDVISRVCVSVSVGVHTADRWADFHQRRSLDWPLAPSRAATATATASLLTTTATNARSATATRRQVCRRVGADTL
jgi:hypothetical protein